VVPLPIVDLLVDGSGLGVAIQHLDGEEVHLQCQRGSHLGSLFGLSVAKEEKPVRLCGTEVEGDGARLLGVPLVERDEGPRGLEGDGVKGRHVLAFKGHNAVNLHFGITLFGHPGELESHVVVFIHNLG
uniref:Uncharacterized protein n=1 Tax=Oncorhynchus tshawytscha TaxID=74940 RepID=A0A8C8GMX2_ONCTS